MRAGAGRSRLLAALRDARRAGVTAAFDPNLRPRLWPDGETMRDGIMRGAAVADVALPSFEDEATHFGDREPAATAARYPATGAGLVVVTNGAGPVHVTGPGGTTDLPVAATEVVDTTAAGDSFNARFCAERLSTSPCRTA